MSYRRTIPVEFNHCDPAGIVFYARYFEMTNSVCENFFAEVVGRSYAEVMAAGEGVPTARLEADFRLPSRLGDRLDWTLTVLRVGRSSLDLALTARVGAGDTRIEVRKTLVWIGRGGKPAAWPREMRARLEAAREHGDE